ncbi:protein-S-isoprenylcysteine O-methyltransferase Ste14 [Rhizobium mesoamericanum]|uniref:isoprenylcysteine carboxylmethyltransferase family protein n=1 Tax=Rhizobium mesoamericanum TaxID=1079800 RepID=UPI002789DB89|nr:isoprenylcysteine carboxylmethyltransferase family protein [Rhizobium mesoamericanum]MDQ0561912.1 protein-S-isoprenylcysteine O-methyltransferase Ste14 [Rhizobium mesoamericanum]
MFIPAGTLDYWQAWAFVVVFGVSSQALGIYFLVHDRALVERRMNIGPTAEQRPAQKFIWALFIFGFVGFVVLPAFDHRFGWSPVAPVVSVIANAVIVLSFLLFFAVMKSNPYAASTIQMEEGQPVVSTGPYAYVRHPMYSGALLLLAAMPLSSVRGGVFSSSCRTPPRLPIWSPASVPASAPMLTARQRPSAEHTAARLGLSLPTGKA